MYLALEQPWVVRAPEPAAESVAAEPAEPVKRPVKKRRARSSRGARTDAAELDESPPPVVLTAAERRVVWRGPEVVLPVARHDFRAEGAGRPLDRDEILSTVRDQSKAVVDCMVAATGQADLRATITVRMLVDGEGRVTKHRVQAPQYLFEHGLTGCLERAVSRLRFPATGAPTLVNAPFELG